MKRILAGLSSFLLLVIIITAVLCSISANFPSVYRISGIKGECSENGDWVLYTNRTERGIDRAVFSIPHCGRLITDIASPSGFSLCILAYLFLLFIGRKRKAPQKNTPSAVRNRLYCESDDDASDCEADTSVSDTSLSTFSYE